MKIILLGMPGSGKDTQAELLEKKHGFKHISPGNIFRQEMESNTQLGIEIKSTMQAGEFVDNETTCEIIKKEIESSADFVLNGFPRNIEQAEWFDEYCKESNIKIDTIFLFDITEQTARDRIKIRSSKIKRPEDATEESLKKRFDIYNNTTLPLVEYYSDRLISIQGNLSQEMISNIINSIIKTGKPNARYI